MGMGNGQYSWVGDVASGTHLRMKPYAAVFT